MDDRVTRAEAARQLGIDRATVTRMVQANPALLDDAGRVSVVEIAALRQSVVNPKLQTRGIAAPMSAAPGGGSGLNEARERSETVKAELAELDLAERLGLTLRRDDVEAAVAQAAEVIKQTSFTLARDRAEVLARISDPRQMEQALEGLMREVLTKASQALSLAAVPADMSSAA